MVGYSQTDTWTSCSDLQPSDTVQALQSYSSCCSTSKQAYNDWYIICTYHGVTVSYVHITKHLYRLCTSDYRADILAGLQRTLQAKANSARHTVQLHHAAVLSTTASISAHTLSSSATAQAETHQVTNS
jgi:hypothetical protein